MNYAYSNPPATQQAQPVTAPQTTASLQAQRWAINAAVSAVLVAGVAGIVSLVAPNTDNAAAVPEPTPTQIAAIAPPVVESLARVEPVPKPTAAMYSASQSCQLLFDSVRLHKRYGQASEWDTTPADVKASVAQSCGWENLP